MSKKVFIINAGVTSSFAGGTLNAHYTQMAKELLEAKGYEVEVTCLDKPWDNAAEVEKFVSADVVILQTPGYWMSTPWQVKKYFDDTLADPRIAGGGDGRHRGTDCKYGTGGILTDKKYMLSSTWNAPLEAFTDPNQFFEGVGIDGVFLPLHKAFQFIGMKPLPSFMANDVLKNPTHEQDFARFKEHINANF